MFKICRESVRLDDRESKVGFAAGSEHSPCSVTFVIATGVNLDTVIQDDNHRSVVPALGVHFIVCHVSDSNDSTAVEEASGVIFDLLDVLLLCHHLIMTRRKHQKKCLC